MSAQNKIPLLVLLASFFSLIYSGGGIVAAPALPEESATCLACHSQHGLTVTFRNNESLEAYVSSDAFEGSVHASLGCSACHTEFSPDHHPKQTFGSKDRFVKQSSLVCRRCHTEDTLKAKPIHAALLRKESGAPVCTSCHNAHAVTTVAGGKTIAGEKQYCLGCHAQAITMTMKNSETASLKVDPTALGASMHAKLSCFDCHFGFSSAEHPKREFRSVREFSITNADACRRCHFDKYSKTLDSIHYSVLSQGNLKAPVCTDCHGAHSVAQVTADKAQTARTCEQCHPAVYREYVSSVHGKALLDAHNTDVPVCVDCHSVHSIQDPRTLDSRERVPEICGKCHANAGLMKKYGLYPGVVNSYLDDFHGMTIKLYRKQKEVSAGTTRRSLATCVDCHGVHTITKTQGPDTNLLKARLVKQCRQCHAGATDEFPDAWLSHYEPSLRNAPLVFLIKLLYKILIPFMLAGLILQICLHVWRYAMYR